MFKFATIGIIGFTIGIAAVEASRTISQADCHMTSSATTKMPSISELHDAVRRQDLPDLTVKEPY